MFLEHFKDFLFGNRNKYSHIIGDDFLLVLNLKGLGHEMNFFVKGL